MPFPKNPASNPGPGMMPMSPFPIPSPTTNQGSPANGEAHYNVKAKKHSMHSRAGALAGLKAASKAPSRSTQTIQGSKVVA
jgi:hypothetical protein